MLRAVCVLLLVGLAVAAALTPSQEQRNATRPYWNTHSVYVQSFIGISANNSRPFELPSMI